MADTAAGVAEAAAETDVLDTIQQRVLWLATRIVDAANHDRDTGDGVKVGGHQASSASLVTVMTALYFAYPGRAGQGQREAARLPGLPRHPVPARQPGPRLPDRRCARSAGCSPTRAGPRTRTAVDFSTGSVGLGAAAPLFAAAARRYVDAHFGARPRSRFVALIGDAELDEGNIWEAVADPATDGLGNVMWIVDVNRQSLDRVVPGMRIAQWEQQFTAAGWHVVEAKYGQPAAGGVRAAPAAARCATGSTRCRTSITSRCSAWPRREFRARFLDGAPDEVSEFCAGHRRRRAGRPGHRPGRARPRLAAGRPSASATRRRTGPAWCSPTRSRAGACRWPGNPRNHSALLTTAQIDEMRERLGLTLATEWDRLDPMTRAGQWAAARREHLARPPRANPPAVAVPDSTGLRAGRPISTQEAFGRILVDLSRDEAVAPYLVTAAPDVATSTNLAGFINRMGVFSPAARRSWSEDAVLKWAEGPDGQHIELGISEMNLFLLLGQLGLAWDLSDQPLLPVGTVYDPFVLRGLDAFIYSVYSGARFVVAGTPSGVSLAPEGGAHQSTITASVGLELPGVTFIEPAYAAALDWLMCGALQSIAGRADAAPPGGRAVARGRLVLLPAQHAGHRPGAVRPRAGPARRRACCAARSWPVPTGWSTPPRRPPGARRGLPGRVRRGAARGARRAAAELADEGIAAHVVDVTSADRLYRAWQRTLRQGVRTATTPSIPGALRTVFPDPGADRHRARRGVAHAELARLGAGRARGQPRRGLVRPVRHGQRPVPGARPGRRLHRQRRPRRAVAARPVAVTGSCGRPAGGLGPGQPDDSGSVRPRACRAVTTSATGSAARRR